MQTNINFAQFVAIRFCVFQNGESPFPSYGNPQNVAILFVHSLIAHFSRQIDKVKVRVRLNFVLERPRAKAFDRGLSKNTSVVSLRPIWARFRPFLVAASLCVWDASERVPGPIFEVVASFVILNGVSPHLVFR